MNIYYRIMRDFSEHPLDTFLAYVEKNMVLDMISSAAAQNPHLQHHGQRKIEEIIAHVQHQISTGHPVRNPEVFLAINNLMYADTVDATQSALANLTLHLALRPIDDFSPGAVRYYRLMHSHGFVAAVDGGHIRPLADMAQPGPWRSTVYFPAESLFSDILPESLYPHVTDKVDHADIMSRIQVALRYLETYGDDIRGDFESVIANIVILPHNSERNASFSWRLNYYGGIFIDAIGIDPYRLAESLLHEYLHQRLWQWWAYEDVPGLPAAEASIVSPLTGRTRPARVMMQALIIYAAALEFYEKVCRESTPPAEVWARRDHLRKGMAKLAAELRGLTAPRTRTAALIDQCMAGLTTARPDGPARAASECTM